MNYDNVLSCCDQTEVCLEACVHDYLHRGEPLLAECCEDAYRAVQDLRKELCKSLNESRQRT